MYDCLVYQNYKSIIFNLQGVENVWYHIESFEELETTSFNFILIYCDFTYPLTPDVVCIIDRGRPKENAVKVIVETYNKRHTFLNTIFFLS